MNNGIVVKNVEKKNYSQNEPNKHQNKQATVVAEYIRRRNEGVTYKLGDQHSGWDCHMGNVIESDAHHQAAKHVLEIRLSKLADKSNDTCHTPTIVTPK